MCYYQHLFVFREKLGIKPTQTDTTERGSNNRIVYCQNLYTTNTIVLGEHLPAKLSAAARKHPQLLLDWHIVEITPAVDVAIG
jgi:hypothetical protein